MAFIQPLMPYLQLREMTDVICPSAHRVTCSWIQFHCCVCMIP